MLGSRTDWTVAATFERSFYIRSGDAFICIGDASIGDGPLNVVTPTGVIPGLVPGIHCATTSIPDIASPWVPAMNAGMTAVGGHDGRFGLGLRFANGVALFANDTCVWQPPLWPTAAPDALTNVRLRALIVAATTTAPAESFLHVLPANRPVDALGRKARTGMADLRAALRDATSESCETAVTILAGLGHGLTPSGDDMLAGALLMLHALGHADKAAALADAVRRIAPARTSPLSFALLEPACDGEPNAAVHRAIEALLTGAAPAAVIEPLLSLGATSGFDILAGMLIAAGA